MKDVEEEVKPGGKAANHNKPTTMMMEDNEGATHTFNNEKTQKNNAPLVNTIESLSQQCDSEPDIVVDLDEDEFAGGGGGD